MYNKVVSVLGCRGEWGGGVVDWKGRLFFVMHGLQYARVGCWWWSMEREKDTISLISPIGVVAGATSTPAGGLLTFSRILGWF